MRSSGVARDADESTIIEGLPQARARAASDVNRHDPDREEKFKEAARGLRDPLRRRARATYDRYGHEGACARAASPELRGASLDLRPLRRVLRRRGAAASAAARAPVRPRGGDIAVSTTITLVQAATASRASELRGRRPLRDLQRPTAPSRAPRSSPATAAAAPGCCRPSRGPRSARLCGQVPATSAAATAGRPNSRASSARAAGARCDDARCASTSPPGIDAASACASAPRARPRPRRAAWGPVRARCRAGRRALPARRRRPRRRARRRRAGGGDRGDAGLSRRSTARVDVEVAPGTQPGEVITSDGLGIAAVRRPGAPGGPGAWSSTSCRPAQSSRATRCVAKNWPTHDRGEPGRASRCWASSSACSDDPPGAAGAARHRPSSCSRSCSTSPPAGGRSARTATSSVRGLRRPRRAAGAARPARAGRGALVEVSTSEVADDWAQRWRAVPRARRDPGPAVGAPPVERAPRGPRRRRRRSRHRRSAPARTRPPGCAWSCCWGWRRGARSPTWAAGRACSPSPRRSWGGHPCSASTRGGSRFRPPRSTTPRVNGVEVARAAVTTCSTTVPAPAAPTVVANLLRPLLLRWPQTAFAGETPRALVAAGGRPRGATRSRGPLPATALRETRRVAGGEWIALLLERP